MNTESKVDLVWWKSLYRTTVPNPTVQPIRSHQIGCFDQGLRAVLNGQTQTRGVWSAEEILHPISYLELMAAFLAIKAFGREWETLQS